MKIKKIVPADLATIDETAARKSFVDGVSIFEKLPQTTPPAIVDFLIKTNFVFDKTKPNDKSALLVIGNLTGEWLKYANGEAKKDKKQTLIGTVTFDATNRCLNVQITKGAAKPTLLKKQAKEWLKKANVSLEILKGGKPMTDEEAEKAETEVEVETESPIDTPTQPTNTNDDAAKIAEINAEAQALQQQINSLATLQDEPREQLIQDLLQSIPLFLNPILALSAVPPKLAAFVAKMRETQSRLEEHVRKPKAKAAQRQANQEKAESFAKKIKTLVDELNNTTL